LPDSHILIDIDKIGKAATIIVDVQNSHFHFLSLFRVNDQQFVYMVTLGHSPLLRRTARTDSPVFHKFPFKLGFRLIYGQCDLLKWSNGG
jgi:hypothetical protein